MAAVGKEAVGKGCPTHDIETVFPAHLYVVALAHAMGMEVGKEDVVAETLMIHPAEKEELVAVVFIAVHYDGCLAAGTVTPHIEGVMSLAGRHDDGGVSQQTATTHTVRPRAHIGSAVVEHGKRTVNITTIDVSVQRERQHVETAGDNGNYKDREEGENEGAGFHVF